jgi:hypothetical protein
MDLGGRIAGPAGVAVAQIHLGSGNEGCVTRNNANPQTSRLNFSFLFLASPPLRPR